MNHDTKTCCVIMPFGETTPTHTEDYWRRHFERFIKPAVERAMQDGHTLGYHAEVIRDQHGRISNNVFERLQHADVVLADLTDANPNVLYELGVRHTLRSSTILIIEKDQTIPFYFGSYDTIIYDPKDFMAFAEHVEQRLIQMESAATRSDNAMHDYFISTQQQLLVVQRHQAAMFNAMRERGLTDFFPDTRNPDRNTRKFEFMERATDTVRVLATTGHAYLANWARHQPYVRSRAEAGIQWRFILLNPWTVHSLMVALGELRAESRLTPTQKAALEAQQRGELRGFDAVQLVQESESFKKLRESLNGYDSMVPDVPAGSIEVRLSPLPVTTTLLLTDKAGFFEPYIHTNLWERVSKVMLTFEVECEATSYLYRHSLGYFERLWTLATPYDTFTATESQYQTHLRDSYA